MTTLDVSRGLFLYTRNDDPEPVNMLSSGSQSRAVPVRRGRRRRGAAADEEQSGPSGDPDEPPRTEYTDASWNGVRLPMRDALFIAAIAGVVSLDKAGRVQTGSGGTVLVSDFSNPVHPSKVYTPYSEHSTIHAITCFCYFYNSDEIPEETLLFFRTFAVVECKLFSKTPMDISWLFEDTYGERRPIHSDLAWWRVHGALQIHDIALPHLMDRATILNAHRLIGGIPWELSCAIPLSHIMTNDCRTLKVCNRKTHRWIPQTKGLRTAVTGALEQAQTITEMMLLPRAIERIIKTNIMEWVSEGLPKKVTHTAMGKMLSTEPDSRVFGGSAKIRLSLANADIEVINGQLRVGSAMPSTHTEESSVLAVPDRSFTEEIQVDDSTYSLNQGNQGNKMFAEWRQRMWPDDPDGKRHDDYASEDYEQFLRYLVSALTTGRMDKKTAFVVGSSGDEGKSLVIYLTSIIYGTNFAEGSSGCITRNQGKTTAAGHQAHLEPFMLGTALIVISDLNPMAILNLETPKRCSGEDSGTCRPSHGKKSIQFWYISKMLIITNGVGPLEPGFKLVDARRMLFIPLVSRFVDRTEAPETKEEQDEQRVYPMVSYSERDRTILASHFIADILAAWDRYDRDGLRVTTRIKVTLTRMSTARHKKLVAKQTEALKAKADAAAITQTEEENAGTRRLRKRLKRVDAMMPEHPAYLQSTKVVHTYAASHFERAAEYHSSTNEWWGLLRALLATNGTGRMPDGRLYTKDSDLPETMTISVTKKTLKPFEDFIPMKVIDRKEVEYVIQEVIEGLLSAAHYANVGTRCLTRSHLILGFIREHSHL